jgi:GNAT superfamily N-acetyltransferase
VHIRHAVPADRAAVLRVFRAAGAAAWSHILPPEVLADNELARFDERLAHMLVAEEEGEVVGFAVARDGELDALYTDPGVWGRGVGRALMDAALEELTRQGFDEATLWTEERNERPRRVYERYGWKLDGTVRVRDYHGTELHELRYRIPLPFVPDLQALSDADLRRLIRELEHREHGVSFERRMLHGKIAIVRNELEARRFGRELD